jgi:hypothetical protein
VTRLQRSAFRIACAITGALLGGLAMMGAAALTRDEEPPRRPAARPSISATLEPGKKIAKPSKLAPQRSVLLAWTPGGLPPATERVLERMTAVRAVTTVEAGLDWIESSRSPEGTVLDRTPGGMAIPFENAYIEPADYADFVPLADRDEIRALDEGDAVLAQTSEELRGAGVGTSLRLKGGSLDITGVVADATTGGYEALTAGSAPERWPAVDRYVLIRLAPKANPDLVGRRIRGLLDPGQTLRLRPSGVNPFLRYGDAVLPQLIMKKTFGEFSLRPQAGSDFFEVEESWRARNIQAAHVPVLGRVVCHRALIPQLRAAMMELTERGLAYTINPGEFAGCFAGRFVFGGLVHRISHHSWGVALDINASENPSGIRPNLDRRLVNVMRDHGFTWGGDWLIPDGMHFEWVAFD